MTPPGDGLPCPEVSRLAVSTFKKLVEVMFNLTEAKSTTVKPKSSPNGSLVFQKPCVVRAGRPARGVQRGEIGFDESDCQEIDMIPLVEASLAGMPNESAQ